LPVALSSCRWSFLLLLFLLAFLSFCLLVLLIVFFFRLLLLELLLHSVDPSFLQELVTMAKEELDDAVEGKFRNPPPLIDVEDGFFWQFFDC